MATIDMEELRALALRSRKTKKAVQPDEEEGEIRQEKEEGELSDGEQSPKTPSSKREALLPTPVLTSTSTSPKPPTPNGTTRLKDSGSFKKLGSSGDKFSLSPIQSPMLQSPKIWPNARRPSNNNIRREREGTEKNVDFDDLLKQYTEQRDRTSDQTNVPAKADSSPVDAIKRKPGFGMGKSPVLGVEKNTSSNMTIELIDSDDSAGNTMNGAVELISTNSVFVPPSTPSTPESTPTYVIQESLTAPQTASTSETDNTNKAPSVDPNLATTAGTVEIEDNSTPQEGPPKELASTNETDVARDKEPPTTTEPSAHGTAPSKDSEDTISQATEATSPHKDSTEATSSYKDITEAPPKDSAAGKSTVSAKLSASIYDSVKADIQRRIMEDIKAKQSLTKFFSVVQPPPPTTPPPPIPPPPAHPPPDDVDMEVDPVESPVVSSKLISGGGLTSKGQHTSGNPIQQFSLFSATPTPTPPYSFTSAHYQPLLTPFSTAESATTNNYIYYNPNVQAQPHTVSPLIVSNPQLQHSRSQLGVDDTPGDATKDTKQVYKMTPSTRQLPESPNQRSSELSESTPLKAAAKIKPTYVLKSPPAPPFIPTQQPPLLINRATSSSSSQVPPPSLPNAKPSVYVATPPSVSSPKGTTASTSVGSPKAAITSTAANPITSVTPADTVRPKAAAKPKVVPHPPVVTPPVPPPTPHTVLPPPPTPSIPSPQPQPSLVVNFDEDDDDYGYVPETVKMASESNIVEQYRQFMAEKKPDSEPNAPANGKKKPSKKIKLSSASSSSSSSTSAPPNTQEEIERLKKLIAEKEALKKKVGGTKTKSSKAAVTTTSNLPTSNSNKEAPSNKRKTPDAAAGAKYPSPLQLDVPSPPTYAPVTRTATPPPTAVTSSNNTAMPSLPESSGKTSLPTVSTPMSLPALTSGGLTLEALQKLVNDHEAALQAKSTEMTTQESQLIGLKGELTSSESKRSSASIRVRVLREQLSVAETMLNECTKQEEVARTRVRQAEIDLEATTAALAHLRVALDKDRIRLEELQIEYRVQEEMAKNTPTLLSGTTPISSIVPPATSPIATPNASITISSSQSTASSSAPLSNATTSSTNVSPSISTPSAPSTPTNVVSPSENITNDEMELSTILPSESITANEKATASPTHVPSPSADIHMSPIRLSTSPASPTQSSSPLPVAPQSTKVTTKPQQTASSKISSGMLADALLESISIDWLAKPDNHSEQPEVVKPLPPKPIAKPKVTPQANKLPQNAAATKAPLSSSTTATLSPQFDLSGLRAAALHSHKTGKQTTATRPSIKDTPQLSTTPSPTTTVPPKSLAAKQAQPNIKAKSTTTSIPRQTTKPSLEPLIGPPRSLVAPVPTPILFPFQGDQQAIFDVIVTPAHDLVDEMEAVLGETMAEGAKAKRPEHRNIPMRYDTSLIQFRSFRLSPQFVSIQTIQFGSVLSLVETEKNDICLDLTDEKLSSVRSRKKQRTMSAPTASSAVSSESKTTSRPPSRASTSPVRSPKHPSTPSADAQSILDDEFLPFYEVIKEEEGDAVVNLNDEEGARYYNIGGELELGEEDRHDVVAWLKVVLSLTKGELCDLPQGSRTAALRHLAAALENNTSSFALWRLYFDLLRYTPGIKWDHQQGIFDDAVTQNPTKHLLWVMYAQQCPDVAVKLSLYERGLSEQLAVIAPGECTDPEQSYAILDLLLLRVRAECESGHYLRAITHLKSVLFKTEALPSSPQATQQPTAPTQLQETAPLPPPSPDSPVAMDISPTPDAPPQPTTVTEKPLLSTLPPPNTIAKHFHATCTLPFLLEWQNVRSPTTTEAQINELRTVFDIAEDALYTRAPDKQSEYLSIYLNNIALELSLRHIENAKVLCQSYLRRFTSSHELWMMYATIEETAENSQDVVFIYRQIVSRDPLNFAVWNAYARFQLTHNGPEQAVSTLCTSIESYIKSIGKEVTPATVRSTFHLLLRLPDDDISSEDVQEQLQHYKLIPNSSMSIYVWLNYLMYEALAGKKRFVEKAFRCALTVLLDRDDRIKLWLEYLAFAKKNFSGQVLVKLVDEALSDIQPYIDVTSLIREPYHAIPTEYTHLITPPPLPDFTFHNRVLDILLSVTPFPQHRFVLERAISLFPEDASLYIRAAELEINGGNLGKARSILKLGSKHCTSPELFKNLLDVDITRNSDETTRADFQLAVEANPISSLLWSAYVAFENTKGDAAIIDGLQQRITESGVELTSSTHPGVL